jgi:hypothetical protein
MALMMIIIIVAIIKYRLDEGCRHPPTHVNPAYYGCTAYVLLLLYVLIPS